MRDRYGYIDGERGSVTVDGVTIQSESAHWVMLQLYKGCIVVLSRAQFLQGLRRGKGWRRAAAMRARVSGAPTVDSSGGPDGGLPREQGDVR